MMMKKIITVVSLLAVFLLPDVALCKKKRHKKKIKTVISAKVASQAAASAPKTTESLTVLLASLTTAVSQINTATLALPADLNASLEALNALEKSIDSIKKQVGSACGAAKKTSNAIKPISLKQEEKIIRDELAPLLKIASRTAEQDAEIAEFNAELATIKTKRIAEKKAAKQAAKNYVIFSNAIGGRIKIYVAQASNPTIIAKEPVFVVKKSMKKFKMRCNPGDVYYLKIENQHGKINKKGKIVKGYHTLHRRKGKGVHYFSSNDKGHQIIINNYRQYEVRSLDYKGKGSLEQVKTQDIAIMVTVVVAMAALFIATGGTIAIADAVVGGSFAAFAGSAGAVAANEAVLGALAIAAVAGGTTTAAVQSASITQDYMNAETVNQGKSPAVADVQQGAPIQTAGSTEKSSLVVSTTGSVVVEAEEEDDDSE